MFDGLENARCNRDTNHINSYARILLVYLIFKDFDYFIIAFICCGVANLVVDAQTATGTCGSVLCEVRSVIAHNILYTRKSHFRAPSSALGSSLYHNVLHITSLDFQCSSYFVKADPDLFSTQLCDTEDV